MLTREAIESIRAIFLQYVQPVTVDLAARLLGWNLDTMDAAIEWRAVTLDETRSTSRASRAKTFSGWPSNGGPWLTFCGRLVAIAGAW